MKNRRLRRRTGATLVAGIICAAILTTPQAQARSLVHEFPSTSWGNIYAGTAKTGTAIRTTSGIHLEAKSKFVVTYKNFPTWAKTDMQAAIDIWAANFESAVPIHVEATWGRAPRPDILGSAQSANFFTNIPNAPDASLYYPSALANAIAGEDLDKKNVEINITANSDADWNTRNDGLPTKNEFDLESVFIHEIAHGLGFLSTNAYDIYFGWGALEHPTPFDAFVQTSDGKSLADFPTPSLALGQAMTRTLLWVGAEGVKANGGQKPLLYTPANYLDGSSVSHIDEDTYSSSLLDSVMTPNLGPGEIFSGPGPLLLAMMKDLRSKPPVGPAATAPEVPRNVQAITGDKSAIIAFDPPASVRTSHITNYTIKNIKTGKSITVNSSPVVISSLQNGVSYTFAVSATNSLGASEAVTTNPTTPTASWAASVLDLTADGKYLSVTSFRNQPAIAYTDSKNGDLKLALWTGKAWRRVTVDGKGGVGGKTSHDVSGPVSVCVSGVGTKQIMHIFYTDLADKDLKYSTYNNSSFTYEVVDGNGATPIPYDQVERTRTAADVSITNACAIAPAGPEVFYRDDDQGVLLGAYKDFTNRWVYEVVDGDRKTDGRTTGDVAFHLRAQTVGATISVIYDSVTDLSQSKQIAAGEIRLATRTISALNSWDYQNLDESNSTTAVVGFEVSLDNTKDGLIASWLASSSSFQTKPDQIRWVNLKKPTQVVSVTPTGYGTPGSPLITDAKTLIFGCMSRLCTVGLSTSATKPTIKLVTNFRNADAAQAGWVTVNKVRYAVANVGGKISLLKP
ncbi:MAG: fibronectin [Actinobacteria bacterium]|uniref:Unannotated protein n=1 Tax=freshwater metagenome TaxID=449393 RepID=A0A6J7HW66_9ZZZZ|nr:fibronectin [Actinomycetota bacterium]MSX24794.1 fibronectin [Actinomycetota bacterium]MSY46200.1 fibronectin [Actinomycetota bacterium]MSY56798.1 fibronectin [Actinomycetota bacterium]MTB00473.1 fibronectin [Actinomycetota bacterium]